MLAAAGSAGAADAPTSDVSIPGKLFEPARITVLLGTTVTWRNGDASNHTVTSEGDTFDSGYLAPGGSFSYTFAKQGHYAYECLIHKFMKGTVDVFSLVLTGPENPVLVGRQVVVAGLAPAGTGAVTLLPARRGRASAHRQGAARRQLHGALPGDGAGHVPRLGRPRRQPARQDRRRPARQHHAYRDDGRRRDRAGAGRCARRPPDLRP